MGQKMINNLEAKNILTDYGKGNPDHIKDVENNCCIKLPSDYVKFILVHNGATLVNDAFDFEDPNYPVKNMSSIGFCKIEKIIEHILNLKSGEEPDWDIKYKFEDGLIPFGDNGGGDLICFDYRKNRSTDNPPIVIWNHDMGFDHRVVFIANNFEEFIGMLHAYED